MWWYKIPVLLVVATANHTSLSDQKITKLRSSSSFIAYFVLAFKVRPTRVFVRDTKAYAGDIQGFFLDFDCVRGHANMVYQSSMLSTSPQNLGFNRPSIGKLPARPSRLPPVRHRLVHYASHPYHPPHVQILLPARSPITRAHQPSSPQCLRKSSANHPQDPPQ